MQGVHLLISAGQIGEGNGAEIRFPARGGTVVLRAGRNLIALGVVSKGALFRFLARAQKVLEEAGHPTRLFCVLPENK